MSSPAKKCRTLQKFIPEYTNLWPVLKPSKIGDNHTFCEVVRQTFPSGMVAGMTVAVMSRQKNPVEIAKLKVENKHKVKLSAMLLGVR